jgi:hypothetical protein
VLTHTENLNKALCRNRKALCKKNKSAMKAESALKAERAMKYIIANFLASNYEHE